MVRSEKGMKYQSSQLVRTPTYISQTFYDAFRIAILIMALMGWSLTNSTLIFVLNSLIRTAVRITFSRKVVLVTGTLAGSTFPPGYVQWGLYSAIPCAMPDAWENLGASLHHEEDAHFLHYAKKRSLFFVVLWIIQAKGMTEELISAMTGISIENVVKLLK